MYPLAIFGLGPPELLLLLLIILIVFGAGKIPQIGSGIGKGLRNFRKSVKGEDENDAPPPPGQAP